MSKKLNRRKPGYTKSGEVRIVSLNYLQLVNQLSKVSKKKVETKIRNRMRILESRPGFVNPVPVVQEQPAAE
jgi:hypothetical protein